VGDIALIAYLVRRAYLDGKVALSGGELDGEHG